MSTIFVLPLEVWHEIFKHCRLSDLLAFDQTCQQATFICNSWFKNLRKLDVKFGVKNYDENKSINADKLIQFLYFKAYKIEHISFAMAPFHLTMASVIRISSICQNLKSLDITQIPTKFASLDSSFVLGLPYFRHLEELKLELQLPVVVVGNKCSHRLIDLPFHQLSSNLKRFTFIGTGISITKMLQTMREKGQKLNNLEKLDFTVRLCIPNLIEELAWFLDFHLSLKTLILRNLMFASMGQILMFTRVILRHPFIKSVDFEGAACCELIDNKLVQRLFDQIRSQSIQVSGDIFSLRFDPNNNNNNNQNP